MTEVSPIGPLPTLNAPQADRERTSQHPPPATPLASAPPARPARRGSPGGAAPEPGGARCCAAWTGSSGWDRVRPSGVPWGAGLGKGGCGGHPKTKGMPRQRARPRPQAWCGAPRACRPWAAAAEHLTKHWSRPRQWELFGMRVPYMARRLTASVGRRVVCGYPYVR